MNEWLDKCNGLIRIHDVKIHIRNSKSETLYYIIYVTYSESTASNGKTAQIISFHSTGDWGRKCETECNKWLATQGDNISIHSMLPITRNTTKNANTLYYLMFVVYLR